MVGEGMEHAELSAQTRAHIASQLGVESVQEFSRVVIGQSDSTELPAQAGLKLSVRTFWRENSRSCVQLECYGGRVED